MPQEFRIVQCCECHMFQVDIVKISEKWKCCICNAKQNLRKEIFRGSSVECHIKVQELNMKTGLAREQTNKKTNCFLTKLSDVSNLNTSNKEEKHQPDLKAKEENSNKCAKVENYIENGVIKFSFSNSQKWSLKTNRTVMTPPKTDTEAIQFDEFNKKSSKWDNYL